MLAMQRQELQKIAEGREAEMFAWEGGTILRLLRDPQAQRQNQWQAAAMEAARSRGVRVPAIHEVTTVLDRPGLVMERIDGPDLLTLIGKRPWTVFRVGRICGEVHAQMHSVKAPSVIPPLRARLKQRIESLTRLPEHLARFALDALDSLPDGDSLCHGDFHPANILMAGETPVVIDWTGATRGDATADYVRTWLTLRMGEPPPGTSIFLRLMSLVGRNLLTSAYVRSYRRERPLDMGLVSRWEIPIAAGRLADGIEEETSNLISLLEEEYGRTG
jgi:Ser/Thr protein kinase RdoA (MazF antagonist)